MMCFRDRTFCPHHEDCRDGKTCEIALTPAVKAAAEAWWGGPEAPICMFAEKPKCHTLKKERVK